MRCMKNDASQVEFQSVVANLLRYCRHGEANRCVLAEGSDTKRLARYVLRACEAICCQARRLFRALIGEGELGRLVGEESGDRSERVGQHCVIALASMRLMKIHVQWFGCRV